MVKKKTTLNTYRCTFFIFFMALMPIIAKLIAFSFSLSPYSLFSTFSRTILKKKNIKNNIIRLENRGGLLGREGEEIGTSDPKDVVVACNQIKPTIYPISMHCYNLYI